jgi:predicted NAD/FAD-dependent oxidoreductase
MPPEEILEIVRHHCRELGVRLPDPEWALVIAWPEAIVVPSPGHYRRAANFLSLRRDGIHFAGDWLTGSTIEGAVRSGLVAAQSVVQNLSGGCSRHS